MFCPKCGKQINDMSKFCMACGCNIKEYEIDNLNSDEIIHTPYVADNTVDINSSVTPQYSSDAQSRIEAEKRRREEATRYQVSGNQKNESISKMMKKKQRKAMRPIRFLIFLLIVVCIGLYAVKNGNINKDTVSNIAKTVEDSTSSDKIVTNDNGRREESNNTNDVVSRFTTISTGNYIVGEDIDVGTYYFHAVSGMGEILVYNSYEDYKSDEYGYDAFISFDVRAKSASVGLTNEDIYTEYVSGIILCEGQCIAINKGVTLEYTSKLEDYGIDGVITPGIYVVGDNLEAGKYTFTALSGMGEFCVFDSYESLKSASSSYDAKESYDIKSPEASTGLTNADVYSNSITNIRLDNGQCIYVRKGVTLSYKDDYSLTDSVVVNSSLDTDDVRNNEVETEVINTSTDDGYAEIYAEYKKKIEDATPGLISEYKKEAANNKNGLEGLAEICNKKVEVLATISNEGVEKMAEYMYKKGSGKYEDYSDWADKLYAVYSSESEKIFNEYMNQ